MGVDGDRKVSKEAVVQYGKIHARGDATSDFASSLNRSPQSTCCQMEWWI